MLADHSLVSPHCQGIQEHRSCPGRHKVQTLFMIYYGIFTFTLSNTFDTEWKLLRRKYKSSSLEKICCVNRLWVSRCEHSHAPLWLLLGLVVLLLPCDPSGRVGPHFHLIPLAPGRLALLAFLEHPMHRLKKEKEKKK